ncbi:flagellar hook capping FlgD N-terminal domain-containing protein [Halanaerobaculum tunisiense]
MDSIQSSQATSSSTPSQQTSLQQSDLGKEEFLELLVSQLQNQNPMEPMKNKEFMGQMAQFNSLQQMQSLNNNMSQFMKHQQLSQAGNLVGKKVKVLNSETGQELTGKVSKVKMNDSDPQVVIGGQEYAMNNIQEVMAEK